MLLVGVASGVTSCTEYRSVTVLNGNVGYGAGKKGIIPIINEFFTHTLFLIMEGSLNLPLPRSLGSAGICFMQRFELPSGVISYTENPSVTALKENEGDGREKGAMPINN